MSSYKVKTYQSCFHNEGLQQVRESVRAVISLKEQCGAGVWYRVGYLNMSNPSHHCPTTWSEYNVSGVRACGRWIDSGCSSAFYYVGQRYNRVCGRVIGYQLTSPGAFNRNPPSSSVDDSYVDGISVTYGAHPRRHIWTFAAGVSEGLTNSFHPLADCPCVQSRALPSPSFIGNDYYCESGNPGWIWTNMLYSDDPLWDGENCEGLCYSNGKSPPWFSVALSDFTTSDIEVRICGDQSVSDEDNPVALMELYVQ